ncbi:MAG TPA: polyprenyl synthetase family protein [bacterium]|nr:polyprenyl synthetase family protein [bacterium]
MTREEIIEAIEARARRAREYLAADDFLSAVAPAHLREATAAYLKRGGKGLRPAVVMFCCGAAGGEEDWALAAAAAAEVTHNWTLIHDDIIDRDELRRGGPTVHNELAARGSAELGLEGEEAEHYGLTVALLAGDMGPCWAAHLLSRLPENGVTTAETAWRLGTELAAAAVPAILAGETEDVRLSRAPLAEVTVEAVEDMLAKKTGVLYEWCARAGATVGGAAPDVIAKLGAFGRSCGTAFQHVDDTLPYFADEGKTGKAAASDLREGKRTAVVLGAYRNAGAGDREYVEATLGRDDATDEEVDILKEKLAALGGVAYARERARRHHERALQELDGVPAGDYRDMLAAWAEFLLARTY